MVMGTMDAHRTKNSQMGSGLPINLVESLFHKLIRGWWKRYRL
jgi:hypothetical protein